MQSPLLAGPREMIGRLSVWYLAPKGLGNAKSFVGWCKGYDREAVCMVLGTQSTSTDKIL